MSTEKTTLVVGATRITPYVSKQGDNRVGALLYIDLQSSTIDVKNGREIKRASIAQFKITSLVELLPILERVGILTLEEMNLLFARIDEYNALSKDEQKLVDSVSNTIFSELYTSIAEEKLLRNPYELDFEDSMWETTLQTVNKLDGSGTFDIVEIVPSIGNIIGTITKGGIVPKSVPPTK